MEETARHFSIGYDLDGGGYEFEPVTIDDRDFLYLDCGLDYLPLPDRHDIDFVVLDTSYPYTPTKQLPKFLVGIDDTHVYVSRRTEHGVFDDSDRECNCHGHKPGTFEAQQREDWVYTGNTYDKPNPQCERCEGHGYVDSPGAFYAGYTRAYEADEDYHPFFWLAVALDWQEMKEKV